MADSSGSPFERFKRFVAEILAVTKEDIQKAKDEAKEVATPSEAAEQAEE